MKTTLTIFALLLCLALSAGDYTITVYGTPACGYTSQLRSGLFQSGIPYTFKDCNDQKICNEMFDFANKYNLIVNNFAYFPIVRIDMNGQTFGFVRPSAAMIVQLLGTTGIDQVKDRVYFYPNPAKDRIYIPGLFRNVEIYGMTGVRLISVFDNQVDISGLKSGQYIVRIERQNYKLIKQ